MYGGKLVPRKPSPSGSCAAHDRATCRLREGWSSHSADEPNSDSQIANLAETDHASIHGSHGEGNASAFQFLTQAVHRLGRAYKQWISAHGETEPPPPRLEFPPP